LWGGNKGGERRDLYPSSIVRSKPCLCVSMGDRTPHADAAGLRATPCAYDQTKKPNSEERVGKASSYTQCAEKRMRDRRRKDDDDRSDRRMVLLPAFCYFVVRTTRCSTLLSTRPSPSTYFNQITPTGAWPRCPTPSGTRPRPARGPASGGPAAWAGAPGGSARRCACGGGFGWVRLGLSVGGWGCVGCRVLYHGTQSNQPRQRPQHAPQHLRRVHRGLLLGRRLHQVPIQVLFPRSSAPTGGGAPTTQAVEIVIEPVVFGVFFLFVCGA
jgi:hypothetical protein